MEYLYDAVRRAIGATEVERPALCLPELERGPEPAGALEAATIEVTDPAVSVDCATKPEFPADRSRLYALRSVDMDTEHAYALEQYRVLRSRVLDILNAKNLSTLMVTSSISGECKTVTAINLALAISQVRGIRVLLVDTDLRKSGIAEVLGVPYELGLHNHLRQPGSISSIVVQLTESLFFVPSCGLDQGSVELLHSTTMDNFVQQVKSSYDIVIFDAPPLFPMADARVIMNLVDAALFCVRAGATAETLIADAIALIRPKLIGTVLAGAQVRSGGWYYYNHDYSQSHNARRGQV